MIIRSVNFLAATGLFLLLAIGIIWKVIPPIYAETKSHQERIKELTTQLADEEEFSKTMTKLLTSKDQIKTYYDEATFALPSSANQDQLMLQLQGLLASMGFKDISISVPITASSSSKSAPAQDDKDTSTKKVVAAAANDISFTLSGKLDFASTQALISRLENLVRWNKIISISFSSSTTGTTVSISTKAFYKPGTPSAYSGDSKLLDKAKTIFDKYQSYTTIPNVTTEGTYGRTDPLAPY